MSLIDFSVPMWLLVYYYFIGTFSIVLNSFTIYLLIFKSETIDNFRYSLLLFQVICGVTDLYFCILMQPFPLFPIIAGFCVGSLAKIFGVWTHYLIAFIVSAILAQLESLTACFIKKHQTISVITKKHVIPKFVQDSASFTMPILPVLIYFVFCETGMNRDDQMELVKQEFPAYLPQFSNLPNFAIYAPNFWFKTVISISICGSTMCGFIFTFTTIDMYRMLRRVRRKVSALNFRRHKSTVNSLLAQFIASSLLLFPLFGFVIVLTFDIEYSQFTTHILLAIFSSRSSVNALVLIATTPPFRNFVLREPPFIPVVFTSTNRVEMLNHKNRETSLNSTCSKHILLCLVTQCQFNTKNLANMTIEFEAPSWLMLYYNLVGTISLFLNFLTIMLIIFKSEKIDNIRYSMLLFQICCTITDFHCSVLMQPIPLFPVMSGYCVGIAAAYFNIWSHYLIAFVVAAIVAQLESLAYCFVKKHQTIASITRRHVVPESVIYVVSMLMPFVPLFLYLAFCQAGMRRDDQLEFVKKHHPEYTASFARLSNYVIYEINFWFLTVLCVSIFGGLLGAFTFTYTTMDMFHMLRRVRRKVSATNFRRHRTTVKSLLAQFVASSFLLIPVFAFVLIVVVRNENSQVIVQIILAVFSLRSSVSAIVLIITTPPFRKFMLRETPSHGFFVSAVRITASRSSFH